MAANPYDEHIQYFGGPEAYAAAITKRGQLGESLSDPVAATAFKAGNPQYFKAAAPVQPAQPTQRQQYQTTQNDILSQLRTRATAPQDVTKTPYYKSSLEAVNQGADLAARNSMEAMNSRNILNSTVTTDRDAQIRQQAMTQSLPGIIEKAYGMQQGEFNNLLGVLNAYSGLEGEQYTRERQVEQDRLTAENTKIEREQKKLDSAWNRVKNIGYVDNIASISLGIPVGTLSSEAANAVEDRSNRLQIAREQNAASMAQTQYTQGQINSRQQNTDSDDYKQAISFAQRDPRWGYVETANERNEIVSEYLNMLSGGTGNSSTQENAEPTDVDLFNEAMPQYINAVNSGTSLKKVYEEIDGLMNGGKISNNLGEIMKAKLNEQFE